MSTKKTRLTIVSRPGCHLCEVVERMAYRLQDELCLDISKCNIEEDADLLQRYGDRVPVVLLDGIEISNGTVTQPALRRAITRASAWARWRKPISRILSRLSGTPSRG